MAGIQLSGLTSGLDTDSIISQLIAIESQPLTRMTHQKTVATTRSQALTDIQTRLKNLTTSADKLKDILLWNPVQTVTGSNDAKFTAQASAGVAPGSHTLKVTQLARAAQDSYTWTPPAADGSLTINGVTLSVAANATIDDVTAQINGNSALGVYAVNVAGKLVLTGRTPGVDSGLITGGAAGTGITAGPDAAAHRDGLNAQGELDGVAFDQATNVITGSGAAASVVNVPGLNITLTGVTAATETIDVGVPETDRAAVKAALKDFVANYNDTLDLISSKITEKKQVASDGAGNATTDTIDYSKGVLFGDSGLRSLLTSMRRAVTTTFSGTGLPNTMQLMSQLGISTGAASATVNADAVAGKLTFDETTFDAAMDSDPTSVQRLLGGVTGVSGFGQAFSELLTPQTQVSGILDQRVETANKQASDLDDQMARLNARLDSREEALRKTFTAMETAMSNSNSQLTSLLDALGQNSSDS